MKLLNSPFYYQGSKFRLLNQILPLFPEKIDTFYDLFGGSAVVSINIKNKCNKVIYNEKNIHTYNLVKMFQENKDEELDKYFQDKIKEFKLTKTYKESYYKFVDYYNNKSNSYKNLFLLSCYSFCNIIRFNKNKLFNQTVGKGDYNYNRIKDSYINLQDIKLFNGDIFNINKQVLKSLNKDDFIYLDPPYYNTSAVYNEKRSLGGWNITNEYQLFDFIENINKNNIKFALSNVFENKGKNNNHLVEFINDNNFKVNHLKIKYTMGSNLSENYKNNNYTDEVLITNY